MDYSEYRKKFNYSYKKPALKRSLLDNIFGTNKYYRVQHRQIKPLTKKEFLKRQQMGEID